MMYGTRVAQHLLFSFLGLVSLASFLQANLWNRNDDEASATCQCDVEEEISKLEGMKTEISDIIEELRCVSKCSKSLVFSGTINEYAKWVQPAIMNSTTDAGLDAITICFWIKTDKTTEKPTALSYAVPKEKNELYIIMRSSKIGIVLKNQVSHSPEIEVGDGKWHHVCFTWKSSDGSVEIYKDGVFEVRKTGLVTGQRITPFGTWIIGQDQDTIGGGFEERNAFDGSLTDVNVWDRILDASQISTLASKNCGLGMEGNYKAYKDFVPQGEVKEVMTSCCE